MIKVIVAGAQGKMGRQSVQAIRQDPELELVAEIGRQDNLAKSIEKTRADVVLDFTLPSSVFSNAQIILDQGARPVIGATGLHAEQIQELQERCAQQKIGGIIAPNFSIGAILMMHFAREASKFFEHAEIIELHHEKKVDAPSGTAIKTAEMMSSQTPFSTKQIPIHSIRLPGLFAHQEVIFGAPGETLTLRHDALDRQCMMPGVLLICKKVMELKHLVYGLEHLLIK